MRKIFLMITLCVIMVLTYGCRNVEVPEDDYMDNDIDVIDEDVPLGNTTTRVGNATTRIGGTTSLMGDDYQTSLSEIDRRLYNSLNDMDDTEFDENDDNYIMNKRAYYQRTANAYKRALDDIGTINYTGDNSEYHDTVIGYYQNGYDTYNNLYTEYDTFETIDDEKTYINEVGTTPFDLRTDVRDAYDNVLNNLRISR